MNTSKKILVAPLNWGLGHASRCIPIIYALKENNFTPIIASDGASLELLKKEFPNDIFETLPDYNIQYSEKGENFKFKIFKQLPKLFFAIRKEKKIVAEIIQKHDISGIISDNRMGIFSAKIPSVYITHQINVLSGNTSWISSKFHQHFIKKYTECWVPDVSEGINLSGKLSHENSDLKNIKFIGPLTRFKKRNLPKKNDLLVILSGPEPQRTLLEEKLRIELSEFNGSILFVKGLVETEQKTASQNNFTFYNYMEADELEIAIQESEYVICRSGYSSIMDLAFLGAKAFLIPTPGQFEQEYLAKKLKKEGSVPSCSQHKFTLDKLQKIDIYSGFRTYNFNQNWAELFACFQSK
ncbi:MAG: glycosyltransferase [Bacteroidota bacterium]